LVIDLKWRGALWYGALSCPHSLEARLLRQFYQLRDAGPTGPGFAVKL
jgi:hypothetical protein